MAQKEAGCKKEKSKKQKILSHSKCCNAYQEELLETVHMFGHCPVCNWAVADHDHYVPHGNNESQFTCIPSPSLATMSTLTSKRHNGYITKHPTIFRAFLDMFNEPDTWAVNAAATIMKEVVFYPCDSCGVGSQKLRVEDMTALFTSLLQWYTPRDQASDGTPLILWQHQFSKCDVLGVRHVPKDRIVNTKGKIPRCAFEFARNGENKECELFSRIYNMYPHFPVPGSLICLGVTVHLTDSRSVGTRGTFVLYGYYALQGTLAQVILFNGVWNSANVTRLLSSLYRFMRRPESDFTPVRSNHPTNVFIDAEEKMVYKVFDSRYGNGADTRKWEYYFDYLNAEHVINSNDLEVVVIKYPYIEGKHHPSSAQQSLSCIEALHRLHQQGLLHMDVRASNIVFTSAEGGSRFIDLDFCGPIGEATYPWSFNMDINDGQRHETVKPEGLGCELHDCFSLAAVLRHSVPSDQEYVDLWDSVTKLVAAGSLTEAVSILLNSNDFKLEYDEEKKEDFTQTGSPPQKRHPKV